MYNRHDSSAGMHFTTSLLALWSVQTSYYSALCKYALIIIIIIITIIRIIIFYNCYHYYNK